MVCTCDIVFAGWRHWVKANTANVILLCCESRAANFATLRRRCVESVRVCPADGIMISDLIVVFMDAAVAYPLRLKQFMLAVFAFSTANTLVTTLTDPVDVRFSALGREHSVSGFRVSTNATFLMYIVKYLVLTIRSPDRCLMLRAPLRAKLTAAASSSAAAAAGAPQSQDAVTEPGSPAAAGTAWAA